MVAGTYCHFGLGLIFAVIYANALPSDKEPTRAGRHHLIANIKRASPKTPALRVSNGSQSMIFDANAAWLEAQAIINKYSQASKFLDGVGLNPDAHPDTNYPPFNDTPILRYFRNSSSLLVAPLSYDAMDVDSGDSPIIGLPRTNYTDFHLMPLKDDVEGGMDISYYGPMQFGTPGQELTVSVDTGSADLWIPVNCPSCSNPQFSPTASSTFRNSKRKVSLVYGAGSVSGTAARDTVTLGSLSVDDQQFVAVRSESEDFMEYPSSGLLGLAFQSISRLNTPNLFENLLKSRKLAAGIFSMHLSRGQEDGSQICFGCYDLTKTVGPIHWLNLTSKTYWTIHMDGMATEQLQSVSTDLTAAVDSGTSLMLVPNPVARQFYAAIPGSQDATMEHGGGFYTFPCSSSLSLSLSFSGKPFSIHMDDFNLGKLSEDSTDCVGGIIGVDPNSGFPFNLAIVGDIFMKSWYSTFDYAGNRIGFAPSVNNK